MFAGCGGDIEISPPRPSSATELGRDKDLRVWLETLQQRHEDRIGELLEKHKDDTICAMKELLSGQPNLPYRGSARSSIGAIGDASGASSNPATPKGQTVTNTQRTSATQRSKSSQFARTMTSHRNSAIFLGFEEQQKRVRQKAESVKRQSYIPDIGLPMVVAETTTIMSVLHYIVGSRGFELVAFALICFNCFVMGIRADWSVKNPGALEPPIFRGLEVTFSIVFGLELLVRVLAGGRYFFAVRNKCFFWNMFDSCLVGFSFIDELIGYFSDLGPNVSALRMLRVLRLMRVLRVIRVLRFFTDLRVMVSGIAMSMKSLVWALSLHFLLEFIFGVVIMDFVASHMAGNDFNDEKYDELRQYFGSFSRTITSMYVAINGGEDWVRIANPLGLVSSALCLFFALYISIAVFCVLNIITGLFVENAKRMSAQDEVQLMMELEALDSRQSFLKTVKALFEKIADPEAMVLSLPGFRFWVTDSEVQDAFNKLGVDVERENATGLFQLLDFNGDGTIDLDEFTLGVQMLHGHARSIDAARIRYNVSSLCREVDRIKTFLELVAFPETSEELENEEEEVDGMEATEGGKMISSDDEDEGENGRKRKNSFSESSENGCQSSGFNNSFECSDGPAFAIGRDDGDPPEATVLDGVPLHGTLRPEKAGSFHRL